MTSRERKYLSACGRMVRMSETDDVPIYQELKAECSNTRLDWGLARTELEKHQATHAKTSRKYLGSSFSGQ
jgi:hypothetical protein